MKEQHTFPAAAVEQLLTEGYDWEPTISDLRSGKLEMCLSRKQENQQSERTLAGSEHRTCGPLCTHQTHAAWIGQYRKENKLVVQLSSVYRLVGRVRNWCKPLGLRANMVLTTLLQILTWHRDSSEISRSALKASRNHSGACSSPPVEGLQAWDGLVLTQHTQTRNKEPSAGRSVWFLVPNLLGEKLHN
ncbi:hypothetical protein PoB_001528300 [Plakobranchus ocellatus]|uniref:Uncharacterized protein n=1 Tax=Plakobranchus ocellatus TaxID=259542 RepID=A0AAV3Z2Q8_9GAST|nr:hypothetical protein PoB_001528300 [Plakobranchus ocellatus]